MVALLHPANTQPAPLARPTARPRHLRLVQTDTSAKASVDPLSVLAIVAIVVTLVLVVLLRGLQGAPPASDWQSLTQTSAPVGVISGASSATVTVVEGDTWATIAARVEPGADPVAFARSLASANSGYQLSVGQVLIVPTAG